MESDDAEDDEGPLFSWVPPEDRLWRHPSEDGGARGRTTVAARSDRPPARLWTVSVAAGLLGALLASGVLLASGHLDRRMTTVLEPVETPRSVLAFADTEASAGTDWAVIANNISPAVVEVSVASASGPQVGSGVLYATGHDTSYLLTSADLLDDGGQVTVSFDTGESAPARVVGQDGVTGIALLAVGVARSGLPTFGSVANLSVATPVLAVGASTTGAPDVDSGTVGGLDEPVDVSGGTTMEGMLALSGMWIGAAADGGALVDQYGDIIGLATDLTSVDTNAPSASYAVPIDVAAHVANQILAGQRVTHPWLGTTGTTDLSSASASALGVAGGAAVGTVVPGSPAAAAGLQPRDVVTEFNGQQVTSSGGLTTLLWQTVPGRAVPVAYLAQGRLHHTVITVTEQPTSS